MQVKTQLNAPPSTGTWYVRRSSDGSALSVQWGISADTTVPADYDGDNKTDIAVFRPSNGIWYIQQSTAGLRVEQFGQNGDRPIPAEYVR